MSGPLGEDAALFPGELASFRDNLVWEAAGLRASTPIGAGPDLHDALVRFQRSVAGPWQPACSFWAQLYFNAVLIPATCLMAPSAERGIRFTAVGASVCPVSGAPLRCIFQVLGADRHDAITGTDLAGCLVGHIDNLVAELNAISGVSRRLLRESADRVTAWALARIGRADPARARTTQALLIGQDRDPPHAAALGGPAPVRRYCCLRDRLPDVPSCGDACPRGRTPAAAGRAR